MYFRNPFLVTESMYTLEGCDTIKVTNATKTLPYSPESKSQRRAHAPLSGAIKAATKTFTQRVRDSSTT
jgi:hypothetical protein